MSWQINAYSKNRNISPLLNNSNYLYHSGVCYKKSSCAKFVALNPFHLVEYRAGIWRKPVLADRDCTVDTIYYIYINFY